MLSPSSFTGHAYLREIHTASTTNLPPEGKDQVLRDAPSQTSLGRLLRLLADPRCGHTHMEAAIAHVDGTKKRDGVIRAQDNVATSTTALSLSDHRYISNLETVLRAADRAITELDTVDTASTAASANNLLRALASASVSQSVEECASNKYNMCVWTPQSRKRLLLLQWLLRRSAIGAKTVLHGVLREEIATTPTSKTRQLTACLVVFELVQRERDRERSTRNAAYTGDYWSTLVEPLIHVVESGSVETPTGVKASKLGVVALDALLAVLCISAPPTSALLSAMEFALATLMQWYKRSSQRQWLVVAVVQLQELVSSHGKYGCSMEMTQWHWNATAMWLCSRSDVVVAVKKKRQQLAAVVTHTIDKLDDSLGRWNKSKEIQSPHWTVAALRRLCVLLNQSVSAAGGVEELQKTVFRSFETTGKLLIVLAASLISPVTNQLAVEMLHMCVLARQAQQPLLLLSTAEIQAFIALVEQQHTYPKTRTTLSDGAASLVAEMCLRRGISIISMLHVTEEEQSEPEEIEFWLCILRHALALYTVVYADDPVLCTQWLRDATRTTIGLIAHHPVKKIRSTAGTLARKLDLVTAMQYIGSTLLFELDPRVSGDLVTLLFQYAHQEYQRSSTTQRLVNVLMEMLLRGPSTTCTSARDIVSPSDLVVKEAPFDDRTAEQDLQFAMSLSLWGWCKHASRETCHAVLSVLIRKVFSKPQDSALLTWLRELSVLGWFESSLVDILPMITSHMQQLERLTDSLLEDNSPDASTTVQQLLFARLAPNLVLRVIPRSAFLALYSSTPVKLLGLSHGDSDSHSLLDLAHLLWAQAVDPLEFKDVKMLSIELLTKLPTHEILPHVLQQLTTFLLHDQGSPVALGKWPHVFVSTNENDPIAQVPLAPGGSFVTAKLMMYYLNRLVTDDSIRGASGALQTQTVCVLLTVLSLPCDDARESFSARQSPLVDLQMGAIECLAVLVVKSLHQTQCTPMEKVVLDLIVENSQCTGGDELLRVWHAVVSDVDEAQDRFSTTQLQICCCNVLLSALSKVDSATLPTFQERILRSGILPTATPNFSPVSMHGSVLAGCLQIAFSFIFRAGPSFDASDCVATKTTTQSIQLVVSVLHAPDPLDDQVYMNTLKVLGALIGKIPWLWPSVVASQTSTAIVGGLQKLCDGRSGTRPHVVSSSVRQLAQSILQAILPVEVY